MVVLHKFEFKLVSKKSGALSTAPFKSSVVTAPGESDKRQVPWAVI